MNGNEFSQDCNPQPQGKNCTSMPCCVPCCVKACNKEPDFNAPYMPLNDSKKKGTSPRVTAIYLPCDEVQQSSAKKTLEKCFPGEKKLSRTDCSQTPYHKIDNCTTTENSRSLSLSSEKPIVLPKKVRRKPKIKKPSIADTSPTEPSDGKIDCSTQTMPSGTSTSCDQANGEHSCNCGKCQEPGHPCDCAKCRAKKDAQKKHRSSLSQNRNETNRSSCKSNSHEHSLSSSRNGQYTSDEMPSTSARKSGKHITLSPCTRRSLIKSELNQTLLHPNSSCGYNESTLDKKNRQSSCTSKERLLIEDNYNPGLIEDCVAGCKDFNAISFGMSFEDTQKIPKELPEKTPMTLLEAFYKRIENEREHMSDALSSKLGFQELNENSIDLYFTCKPRTQINEALASLFKAEALYEESVQLGLGSDVTSYNIEVQQTELPLVGGCPITVECFTGITKPNLTRKSGLRQSTAKNIIKTDKKKF